MSNSLLLKRITDVHNDVENLEAQYMAFASQLELSLLANKSLEDDNKLLKANVKSKEWISIKDRQPEHFQGNIVIGHNGSYLFECEFDNGDWCSIGGDEMTHWMTAFNNPE